MLAEASGGVLGTPPPRPLSAGDDYSRRAALLARLEQGYQVAIQAQAAARDAASETAPDRDPEAAPAEEVWANINMQAISRSRGIHGLYVWESAATWQLPAFVEGAGFAGPYLDIWGMRGADAPAEDAASSSNSPPRSATRVGGHLTLEVTGHEEFGGHTWYMVECHASGLAESAMVLRYGSQSERPPGPLAEEDLEMRWRAPRRLAQLRESLHGPVKAGLGAAYGELFAETPFAKTGAPRGTTARLSLWLGKLAELVNNGALPSGLLARTLLFFRGPPMPNQAKTIVYSGEDGGHVAVEDDERERSGSSADEWDAAGGEFFANSVDLGEEQPEPVTFSPAPSRTEIGLDSGDDDGLSGADDGHGLATL